MVKDDERWRKIGKGVKDFKPANLLNLSSDEDTSPEDDENSQILPALPTDDEARANDEVQALPALSSDEELATENAARHRKRPSEEQADHDTNAAKRNKRFSFSRTKQGLNPAFKNPISTHSRDRIDSNNSSRPQTATGTKILVPATVSPEPRRSASDPSIQPRPRLQDPELEAFVPETSYFEQSSSLTESLEVRPLKAPGQSSSSSIIGVNRYPGNQEQLAAENMDMDDAALGQPPLNDSQPLTIRLSQSFRESEIEVGTMSRSQNPARASDQVLERSSDPIELSGSFNSTDIATQEGNSFDDSSPLASRSRSRKSPARRLVVDTTIPGPPLTRRGVLGSVSSPVPGAQETEDEVAQDLQLKAGIDVIKNLRRRAKAGPDNTNHQKQHDSFIPDYLQTLAREHNLVHNFRPVQAPETIRNETRGYWRLLIKISDVATVANARQSPFTESQWSEKRHMLRQEGTRSRNIATQEDDAELRKRAYPPKNPEEYSLWTADEFIKFWEYVSKTVERVRAGYDARATITSLAEVDETLLLDVRVWCYAEALSHVWLVLFGLSHGLTAQMPLRWFIPGQGYAMTMSGQLKLEGTLGRWVEKEYGVNGSWGVEEG